MPRAGAGESTDEDDEYYQGAGNGDEMKKGAWTEEVRRAAPCARRHAGAVSTVGAAACVSVCGTSSMSSCAWHLLRAGGCPAGEPHPEVWHQELVGRRGRHQGPLRQELPLAVRGWWWCGACAQHSWGSAERGAASLPSRLTNDHACMRCPLLPLTPCGWDCGVCACTGRRATVARAHSFNLLCPSSPCGAAVHGASATAPWCALRGLWLNGHLANCRRQPHPTPIPGGASLQHGMAAANGHAVAGACTRTTGGTTSSTRTSRRSRSRSGRTA